MKTNNIHYGSDAVKKAREVYGAEITDEMIPVILAEGYADGVYTDTKGIQTTGVGQTMRYARVPFPDVFAVKRSQLESIVPGYDDLPTKVRTALMLAHYRGDWLQSPKARALFSEGKYVEAAKEFLDNDDYRASVVEGTGIYKRFNKIAKAIASMSKAGGV